MSLPCQTPSPLNVLLETSPTIGPGGARGLGRYVRELEAALRSFALVTTFDLDIRPSRLGEFEALTNRQSALRQGHDLLHAPTPYHAPLAARSPWVSSILDVIPLDVAAHRRTGLKARFFFAAAKRADHILTISEYSARRIEVRLRVPREKITVAPLPPVASLIPSPDFLLPQGIEPKAYAIGQIDLSGADPRKRAIWLSGVGRRLEARGIPLIVVGTGTDRPSALPHTRGMGRLDDTQWATLLSNAGVFVYTSAYEGQGLPPLEAMSLGTPVVAMRNTAISEVVGESGILIDEIQSPSCAARGPHRVDDAPIDALSDAVLAVLSDASLRGQLSALGQHRATSFSRSHFNECVRRASMEALNA